MWCVTVPLGFIAAFAPFYCEYGVNIHVGEGCFVNYNCIFLDVAPITLGNGVWIGANVTLATPNHPLIAEERLSVDYPDGNHDLEYASPITIKYRCWICSSATICGGVTIGENSIAAAGAVVTRDVPPNSIVAGAPAKVIREIDEGTVLGFGKLMLGMKCRCRRGKGADNLQVNLTKKQATPPLLPSPV